MPTVIRRGVFETNSSSMHSLTWAVDDDGWVQWHRPLTVYCGEFGWQEETYEDIESKISYLLTHIANHYHYCHKNTDEFTLELHQEFLEKPLVVMLKEVYLEYTHNILTIPYPDPKMIGYYPYGYIDHQSSDNLTEIFNSDDIRQAMTEYIFNRGVVVYTDNDNH